MLKHKLLLSSRILNIHKMAIKQVKFYDLYALEIILSMSDIIDISNEDKNRLSYMFKTIVRDISTYYKEQINQALISEAQNCDMIDQDDNIDKNKLLSNGIDPEPCKNKNEFDSFTPKQFELFFTIFNWQELFGGQKWANVAKVYGDLCDAMKSNNWKKIFGVIDRVHQLEHNTDSIFASFLDTGGDEEWKWISDALTDKSIMNSLSVIKNKVSPYLKSFLEKIPGSEDISQDEIDKQRADVMSERASGRGHIRQNEFEQIAKYKLKQLPRDEFFEFITYCFINYNGMSLLFKNFLLENNLLVDYYAYLNSKNERYYNELIDKIQSLD